MTRRQKKLSLIIFFLTGFSLVVMLVLYALKNNIDLYFTPTQIFNQEVPRNAHFRIGGIVEKGSVHYDEKVSFILSDTHHRITVYYEGILPDLFREGQGIVANGRLNKTGSTFIADEVLAKHDENYMPPNITR
jgi:cytochrome c-type biogenesis protein CcmE